uniref:(northern house mosquito) hypothetical protein n=1 Tax=Culex pipiens TaxID=7175 RepID=A0A8D8HU69_CULPI
MVVAASISQFAVGRNQKRIIPRKKNGRKPKHHLRSAGLCHQDQQMEGPGGLLGDRRQHHPLLRVPGRPGKGHPAAEGDQSGRREKAPRQRGRNRGKREAAVGVAAMQSHDGHQGHVRRLWGRFAPG